MTRHSHGAIYTRSDIQMRGHALEGDMRTEGIYTRSTIYMEGHTHGFAFVHGACFKFHHFTNSPPYLISVGNGILEGFLKGAEWYCTLVFISL